MTYVIIYFLIGTGFAIRNIRTDDYFCKPPAVIEFLFWPGIIGRFILWLLDSFFELFKKK